MIFGVYETGVGSQKLILALTENFAFCAVIREEGL